MSVLRERLRQCGDTQPHVPEMRPAGQRHRRLATVRKRYTRAEIEWISAEYQAGTPVRLIAQGLGRTVGSIVGMASQRGMCHSNATRRRKNVAQGCSSAAPL